MAMGRAEMVETGSRETRKPSSSW